MAACHLAQNTDKGLDEAERMFRQVANDSRTERDLKGLALYNLGIVAERKAKERKKDGREYAHYYNEAKEYYDRALGSLDGKERQKCRSKLDKSTQPSSHTTIHHTKSECKICMCICVCVLFLCLCMNVTQWSPS